MSVILSLNDWGEPVSPVTKPGSFSPVLSKSKHRRQSLLHQRGFYSQGSQGGDRRTSLRSASRKASTWLWVFRRQRIKKQGGLRLRGRQKVIGKRCDQLACSAHERLHISKGHWMGGWTLTHTQPLVVSGPISLHQLESRKNTATTPCSWTTAQANITLFWLSAAWRTCRS